MGTPGGNALGGFFMSTLNLFLEGEAMAKSVKKGLSVRQHHNPYYVPLEEGQDPDSRDPKVVGLYTYQVMGAVNTLVEPVGAWLTGA